MSICGPLKRPLNNFIDFEIKFYVNVIPVYDYVTVICFPKSVHHTAFCKMLLSCLIEREKTVIAIRPNSADPSNPLM